MGTEFSWFFDAVVVGLFLIYIYIGGKRGFIGSVLILCSYVISVAIAFFGADIAAPMVYEKFCSEKISSSIQMKIENIDISTEIQKAINRENMGIEIDKDTVSDIIDNSEGNIFEALKLRAISELEGKGNDTIGIPQKLDGIFSENIIDKFLNLLPPYVSDIIKESVQKGTDSFSEIIKMLNSKSDKATYYIESKLVRPAVTSVIATVLFVVIFLMARLITGILFGLVSGVDKIPIVGSLDTFLGMILGIVEAALVILLIVMVLKFMIAFTNNEMIAFNLQNIDNTYIFKWFYNLINFN